MVFRTTVTDDEGQPIPDCWVTANDLITGKVYGRSTDGAGYADVNTMDAAVGHRVTMAVLDPQMRFKGDVQGDALEITAQDQDIRVVLRPFV